MRLQLQRVEPVAADRQLVAVAQRRPLDLLAVDGDAVEAAVVEDAQDLAGLGDDERVATGDAGIVKLQVGVGAAPDPRPAALDREAVDRAVVIAVDEMVAASGTRAAGVEQPGRRFGRPRNREFGGCRAVVLARLKNRVAAKARAAAVGAPGQFLGLGRRQLRAAADAVERPRAGDCAGLEAAAGWTGADAVEDLSSPFPSALRS